MVVVSAVFTVVAGVFAAEVAKPVDPPKSLAAKEAMRTLESAKRKAQQEYDQAVRAATSRAVKDLTAAEGAAARGGNQDEVARIKAVIDELTATSSSFTIAADKPWQPTMHVHRGQQLRIKASGTWSYGWGPCGPGGVNGQYQLTGRIGSGQPFDIGESMTLKADADGDLSMQMKDAGLKDNSGELQVEISAGS